MESKVEKESTNYYAKLLADAEAKKASLESLIVSLRAALATGAIGSAGFSESAALPAAVSSVPTQPMELPKGALLGKSIPVAIKLILSAARSKLTTKEISQGLRDGGIESTAGNFEQIVANALHRLKKANDVLRFSDGWGLAEWYPDGFKSRIVQGKTKSKGKKKSKIVKRFPRLPAGATASPTGDGVQGQLELLFKHHPQDEFTAQEAAKATGIERVQTVGLLLGKLAKQGLLRLTAPKTFTWSGANARVN
jgi:hypothetical protein